MRLAVLGLVAVLAGCAAPEPGDAPLVRIDAGQNLGATAAAGGDVWVNDFGAERLLRVDARDGRVLQRLRLGRRLALGQDGDTLWALRWGGRFFRSPNGPLYRIDAVRGRVTQRIALDPAEVFFDVLVGGGDVWVWGPRRIVRVDAGSGRVAAELDVAGDTGELTGVAPVPGGLLAATAGGRLLRVARDRAVPGRRVAALAGAVLLAVDGDRAVAAAGGALIAVDARTGRLLWRRQLGFWISTLVSRAGVLLAHGAALGYPGDRLWAIDPARGRVLAAALVPSFGTTSMLDAGGALWFATSAGELIVAPPLAVRSFLARAR